MPLPWPGWTWTDWRGTKADPLLTEPHKLTSKVLLVDTTVVEMSDPIEKKWIRKDYRRRYQRRGGNRSWFPNLGFSEHLAETQ